MLYTSPIVSVTHCTTARVLTTNDVESYSMLAFYKSSNSANDRQMFSTASSSHCSFHTGLKPKVLRALSLQSAAFS